MAWVGLRKQALVSVATPQGRKLELSKSTARNAGPEPSVQRQWSYSLGQPKAPPQRPQYPAGHSAKTTPC